MIAFSASVAPSPPTAVPSPGRRRSSVISRQALAAQRARQAHAALAHCHLCAHRCGANRLAGGTGPCHAGNEARVFLAQTEVADELALIPVFAVTFSGCDLRCDFCISGRQSWDPRAGIPVGGRRREEASAGFPGPGNEIPHAGSHLEELAALARAALAAGARSVMLLGGEPTIHLPTALEFVSLLPEDVTLVWKTNAHATAEARALLDGVFDVWVADYKFGSDRCAQRLARVRDYTAVVRENVRWAHLHADLIVRHLIMPGHVDCCWRPVAEWLAAELPGVKVSLRDGFWPAWFAARHPELRRPPPVAEHRRAVDLARAMRLNLVP
ncbi:MAG: radical SAM protein [Verrucomicrobiae bacterium]|nr:radical SAM protein [Verrucomicrobiae bacterium]